MTEKVPTTSGEDPAMALLERLYAPLMKQMNLTSEKSRRFYEVIFDCKMKGQAQMAELLRHEDLSKMTGALGHSEGDGRHSASLTWTRQLCAISGISKAHHAGSLRFGDDEKRLCQKTAY